MSNLIQMMWCLVIRMRSGPRVSKSLQVARKVYCDIGAPSMYTSVNLDIMQYICGFCGVETYHVFFEQALGRHLSFLLGQFKPTKDDKWSVEY